MTKQHSQFNKTTNVDKKTFMNVVERILEKSSLTLDDLHHNVCLTNYISRCDLLGVLHTMELNKKVRRIGDVYCLF